MRELIIPVRSIRLLTALCHTVCYLQNGCSACKQLEVRYIIKMVSQDCKRDKKWKLKSLKLNSYLTLLAVFTVLSHCAFGFEVMSGYLAQLQESFKEKNNSTDTRFYDHLHTLLEAVVAECGLI